MNYIFTNVGYDIIGNPSSMPTIMAEVSIYPSTQKEWRDIHKLINAKTYEEIHQLEKMFNPRPALPNIKNVYFNNPVTVVLWDDGTKTLVRCQDGDTYSRETGLALCVAKKAMGNNGKFNDIFHKWIPEEKKEKEKPKKEEHKMADGWEVCCETCARYDYPAWDDACITCAGHTHWEHK